MHQHRRRKKHPSYGMRTIEICRSQIGFGFTISGQAPCMLSCIVNASPAEKAGLKPGEYVIAVNGQNVSKALHDDVVRLIGNSTGVLKLQIAENYYSDSSDEEVVAVNRPKVKHSAKSGNKNNLVLSSKSLKRAEKVVQDLQAGLLFQRQYFNDELSTQFTSSSPKLFNYENDIENIFSNGQTNELTFQKNKTSNDNSQTTGKNFLPVLPKSNLSCKTKWGCPSAKSNSGICKPSNFKENSKSCVCEQEVPNYVYFSLHYMHAPWSTVLKSAIYKSVIGYLGTIEMPKENDLHLSRLQIIRNCIRRLRIERKVHTLVLFTIFADKIVLINPRGLLIATYPTDKIIFSGIYADDKKFFGLVTSQGNELNETLHNKDLFSNSSCHVFMIDAKLAKHETHVNIAKMFDIKCESDDGRQCSSFPESAEPVLHAMSSFYDSGDHDLSPILANMDLIDTDQSNNASSNSSNSDSGIGFRDDCNTDHVFIVDVTNPHHHSVLHDDVSDNLAEEKTMTIENEVKHVTVPVPSVKNNDTAESVRLTVRAMPNPIGYNKSTVASAPKKENYHYENKRSQNSLNKAFIWTNAPASNYKTNSLKAQDAKQIGGHVTTPEISNQFYDTVPILHKLNSSSHKKLPSKYDDELLQSSLLNMPGKLNKNREEKSPAKDKVTEKENAVFNHFSENDDNQKGESAKPPIMDKKLGNDNVYSINSVMPHAMSDKGNRLRSSSSCSLDSSGTLSGVAQWAVSFEKLLEDPLGLHTFAEFMKKQFCHENIYFWIACERFRKFAGLQEMKTKAKEIFHRHLSADAWEPVNVDSLARQVAQDNLENPTKDLFRLAQQQIYNLMKYDCYARFLKSSLYKEILLKEMSGETLTYDIDEKLNPDLPYSAEIKEKPKKEELHRSLEENRRKSLLPWHRVKLSKNKENNKGFMKSSEFRISFNRKSKKGQQNVQSLNSSYTSSSANNIMKLSSNSINKDPNLPSAESSSNFSVQQGNILCRVVLPDQSSTVIQTKPNLSIYSLLYSLLEKRGLLYSAIDIFLNNSDKVINPLDDSSSLECQEIRVEDRVIFQLKLPNNKTIIAKTIPTKVLQDVLEPILDHYGYKLEYVNIEEIGNRKIVNFTENVLKYNNCQFVIKLNDKFIGGENDSLNIQLKKGNAIEIKEDKTPYTILCNTDILKGEIVVKFDILGILELKPFAEKEAEDINVENKNMSLVRRNSIHLGSDVSKQMKSKFQQTGRSSIHESRGVFQQSSRRISLLSKTSERTSSEENETWKHPQYDQLEDEARCEISCEIPEIYNSKTVHESETASRMLPEHRESKEHRDASGEDLHKVETVPLSTHLSASYEIKNKVCGNIKDDQLMPYAQRQLVNNSGNHLASIKSKIIPLNETVAINQLSSNRDLTVNSVYDRRLSYPVQMCNPFRQNKPRTVKSVFQEGSAVLPPQNFVMDRKELFEKQKKPSYSLQHSFVNKLCSTEGQKTISTKESSETSHFGLVNGETHFKPLTGPKVPPDNCRSTSSTSDVNPVSSSQSSRMKDTGKDGEKGKTETSSRFYLSVNRVKHMIMNQKEQSQKNVKNESNDKKQLNISFV